jgi:hypothetical protein
MLSTPGSTCAQPAVAQDVPPGAGAIQGAVTDSSGSAVVAAVVTLEAGASASQRTTITDDAGAFHFSAVPPGSYVITINAGGFAVWKAPIVTVVAGEDRTLPPAVLQVARSSSKVDVGLSQHELASEQVKAEEQQRLLGIFPHFFVAYEPNPAPLTAAQKFQLGWKTIIDPVRLLGTGIAAAIEQERNTYREFGQGTEGYAKRFGAQYANRVSNTLIGHVLTQSVFHQDPRYFYKGTGSIRSRFLYAIATAFVCKGDNGHWQPDYSDVLGGAASSEISTLYYPASSRTELRLFHNVLEGFGGRAAGHLAEEFVLRKLTTHVPNAAAATSLPVLREGTPVTLISVEDLSAKTAANAGPIAFVLAGDLQVDGVVVAKAGSRAEGQASYVSESGGGGNAMHVRLERVRLKVGNAEVPLRSTRLGAGDAPLEYHRMEDSGRIAVVLYVAANTPLPLAP